MRICCSGIGNVKGYKPSALQDQVAKQVERIGYAEATFKKDRRINIRISQKDLDAIQMRALEEGIPYQTLIASVLHKYLSGRLIERPT